MARKSTVLYPYDNSGPDALEQVLAGQLSSGNPLMGGYLIAARGDRELLRQANNERATQYMQDQQDAAEAGQPYELLKSVLPTLATQKGALPGVLASLGFDPETAQALADAEITKSGAESANQLAGAANSASEAGVEDPVDLMHSMFPDVTQGTSRAERVANINARAQRDAAALRSRGGGSLKYLKTGTTTEFVNGKQVVKNKYAPAGQGTDDYYDDEGNPVDNGSALAEVEGDEDTDAMAAAQASHAEAYASAHGFRVQPGSARLIMKDGKQAYEVTDISGKKGYIDVSMLSGGN